MEHLHGAIDVFVHLDTHLADLIQHYGGWTYLILCGILFCETGLVVTPFLPGDSLLFAVGALAAGGALKIAWLYPLLAVSVVAGDNVNYLIGSRLGPKAFTTQSRFFKREHLDRTHKFYEKYGVKTIVLARFIPIIRTFAPFVAGIGTMRYLRFLSFSVIGGLAWIAIFLSAGYFFGNLPAVKHNFSLVILAIIAISVLPAVLEYLKQRKESARAS